MRVPQARAFTLAEVLITLGIIGVVAAMVLPGVIQGYEKQVTVNKLKKAYTTLTNAIQMSKNVNGDVSAWDIKFGANLQYSSDFADQYLIPYMNVARACKTDKSGDCAITVNRLNGNPESTYHQNYTSFFTNDGIKISVGPSNTSSGLSNTQYTFLVDINGNRHPNNLGKDAFIFTISTKTGVLRANFGTSSDETIYTYCNKANMGGGHSCAAKIMRDGWQIKDDYPW